ncbi:maleylacetoacetate isomerase [Pseudomonas sp. 22-AL-CL-001]|uniref:maleylacetoacetate isomerase n=1 Tax=Pseudomonas alabamensis TaxID=3064349 RepID=UPI002712AB1F|nr:maleylacetoacetate isomerase [Pseudomonas sp. 22-AL-CL-001]MDO7911118.1 maleylacetoacetate isomerase [Pseudomonas sp. 22-AL-CL-001]
MELFTYYRSTASYRVRIALALKGLQAQALPVNLLMGEQQDAGYLEINPQGRVPALRLETGQVLTQSMAILDYLEERWPTPPLLPADLLARAQARSIAGVIGCDVHPLHNVAVLRWLRGHGVGETDVQAWITHWIGRGLVAVEQMLGEEGYCLGPTPGWADVFVVPQVYAAQRFGVGLEACPRIQRVVALAERHPAFIAAHPQAQADTPG